MIAFVWAQAANGVIGKDGRLPWHLADDLHYFKELTTGHFTVMGRRTYEGLPTRPLPNRTNVVLTRDAAYQAPGAQVVHEPAAVLELASAHPDETIMVVGGAQVFAAFADVVDTLYVTRLAGTFAGDTTMPALDWDAFERTAVRPVENADPALNHTFETWQRIKPA